MSEPADEAAAYALLEFLRWPDGRPRCPHCDASGRSYLLRPVDPAGRRTRTGAVTARRVWKCGACRRQFSVWTGTVWHGTGVSARVWVRAAREWASLEQLGPGRLAEHLELSVGAAGGLRRRLRAAADAASVSAGEADRTSPAGLRRERRAAEGDDLLAAILALDPVDAARVRVRTPGRRRSRTQRGPSAQYGD